MGTDVTSHDLAENTAAKVLSLHKALLHFEAQIKLLIIWRLGTWCNFLAILTKHVCFSSDFFFFFFFLSEMNAFPIFMINNSGKLERRKKEVLLRMPQ